MSADSNAGPNRNAAGRKKPATGQLPRLRLPGGRVRISDTAGEAGLLLEGTGIFFIRDGKLFLLQAVGGEFKLTHVDATKFASAIEDVARVLRWDGTGRRWVPAVFNRATADLILAAHAFVQAVPAIQCLTRCPVLVERNGSLIQLTDYDKASGILAGGTIAPDLAIPAALPLLRDVMQGFQFVSPADRSRALAALVTPALIFGGLLGSCRAPVTVVEANESQTGKGYLVRLMAAMYRDVPAAITQKKGGVGGLEEDFDSRIIDGRTFIYFDNVRGKFDSPKVESFLTEDTYSARVPYAGSIEIDPRKTIVLMTSNQADLTRDFANRANTVRLLKQPTGHEFRTYAEGGLLEHVRANQPQYLGAVFAVIHEWHARGKPSSKGIDHDFGRWAGALDWIVVNVLSEAPLMDGHREVQRRMTTPELNWLRDVTRAVGSAGLLDQWLRPIQVLEAIQCGRNVDIPGLKDGDDIENNDAREKVYRAIGRRLWKCLSGSSCKVDGFLIEHRTTTTKDDGYRERSEYRFQLTAPPKSPGSRPECDPEVKPKTPEYPEETPNIFSGA